MVEMRGDEMDVGAIMARIRENVQRRHASGGELHDGGAANTSRSGAFPFSAGRAHDHMNFLRLLQDPKPQGPIAARGSILIKQAKHFIRRLLAPYHRAIFARQAEFNANVVGLMADLLQTLEKSSIDDRALLGETQTRLDALQAQQADQVQRAAEQAQALAGLTARLDALQAEQEGQAQQAATHAQLAAEQAQTLAGLTTRLDAFQAEQERSIARGQSQMGELADSLRGQHLASDELAAKHVELFRHFEELRQEMILQKRRLDLILSELRKKVGDERKSLKKVASQKEHLMDHSYFLFENQYRLSREVIRDRQEIYVPVFEQRLAALARRETATLSPVLDVGCGRGEFLELLKEHGIPAKGIDLNEDMVYFCQERGLDVQHANAFDYLKGQPDDSLGGIIACQVIEHLSVEELIEFIKLCCQKLEKGGRAVFETVNPLSVLVSATNFYLDLSHVRQIHPLALQFLAEAVGFINTEIKFLSPYPDESKLQLLSGSDAAFQQINENFGRLNDILFGYQDYAIICEK